LGMVFRTSYKVDGTLARATGAVHQAAWRQAVYAVLVVIGAWIGHPFGVTGVALAVVIALVIFFILLTQLSISITQMYWMDLLKAFVPAMALTVIASAVVWLTATTMRELSLSASTTLLTSIAAAFFIVAVFVRFAPTLSIGENGVWWLQTLSKYILLRVNRAKQTKP
jgi:hypothetical protein